MSDSNELEGPSPGGPYPETAIPDQEPSDGLPANSSDDAFADTPYGSPAADTGVVSDRATTEALSTLDVAPTEGAGRVRPGRRVPWRRARDGDAKESDEDARREMDFFEHLEELRARLIRSALYIALGTIVGWCLYRPYLYHLLLTPVREVLRDHHIRTVFRNFMEPLMTQLRVSIGAGILFSFPLVFCEAWAFVWPALTSREKRHVAPLIPFSFVLFLAGVSLGFLILPVLVTFLLRFAPPGADVMNFVQDYIPMVVKICVSLGIVFQMPVVFLVLGQLGVVTSGTLLRFWRHAVLLIFVAAAIITPTVDPVNMSLLAVPICFLYLLSILLVKWVEQP